MARPAVESRIGGACAELIVDFASEADDDSLRRLLRETPMPGPIQISLEREPSYFGSARAEGGRCYVVCARDPETGRVVGMGSRVVRELFINGEPQRVGYLSQLRLEPGYRHWSRKLLRRGFSLLRDTRAPDEAPFDITTIVSGNAAARRMLESGQPGFPRYTPVERILTMAIAAGREKPLFSLTSPTDCPCQFQTVEPLPPVWDQRVFKQTVVRGYSPWLRRCRWLLRLPPVGTVLPIAYVTRFPLEVDTDCRWLVFGLAARNPVVDAVLKLCRPRVYESTLYVVHEPRTTLNLDGRLAHLEVALL